MKIADSCQMRKLDQMTIEKTGIPAEVLMENAGRAVYRALADEIENLHLHRIVILCGAGNNGGDGFVIARYLADVVPFVLLFEKRSNLKGASRIHADAAFNIGIPIQEINEENKQIAEEQIKKADIVIDALFGTGINRPLDGLFSKMVNAVNASNAWVVSVDIPSGLSADSSYLIGPCIHADITVTFGLPKPGLLLYPAAKQIGKLIVADISIPKTNVQKMNLAGEILTPECFPVFYKPIEPDSHKGSQGHLLIIAGSPGKTGAAILAAKAAAHAGTGLVTVAIPGPLNTILENNLIEVMTLPMPGQSQFFTPDHVKTIVEALPGKTAVLAGPGLGTQAETIEFLRLVSQEIHVPFILDADALNCASVDPKPFFQLDRVNILTPHPGEFSRLVKQPVEDILNNQIEIVSQYSQTTGNIIVFKTARTIIAKPDGSYLVNVTGNSGLASGGSGDVLAGLIAGLAARNIEPEQAVAAGVFWHGLTADITAANRGQTEMLAGDLMDYLADARTFSIDNMDAFDGRCIPWTEQSIVDDW